MAAVEYEICVSGAPPAAVVDEWEGVTTVHRTVTVLRGTVAEQVGLHGLLRRLLEVDLQVIHVRILADGPVVGGSGTRLQGSGPS